MHGHDRSKLETFGDDLFMVISTVAYVDHEEMTENSEVVTTGQVMIFLGDHFVITVRRGEHAQLSALRRSLEADPERLARGPSEVLYAITDKIIDDYMAVVDEIETDVDEVESAVFARGGSHEVDRVYQLKRELIEFKRCVLPLGAPLMRLATRELPVVPPQARAYFRELADHHTQVREAVASFDEVLSSILQAGLARASVADNEDMRKISAWVAIVAVPTMVAGIYGMNFDIHARAALALRLLRGARPDRADHGQPLRRVQTQPLALAAPATREARFPSGSSATPSAGTYRVVGLLERGGAGAGQVQQHLAGLRGDLVLAEDLVLRRDGLADRGEVATASAEGVAEGGEPDPQHDADAQRDEEQREEARGRRQEDQQHEGDEQARRQPGLDALGDHRAPGASAEHALDGLEVGADDGEVLHLELLVGEVVDGALRLVVGVVDADGLGELELEERAGLRAGERHGGAPRVENSNLSGDAVRRPCVCCAARARRPALRGGSPPRRASAPPASSATAPGQSRPTRCEA